MPIPINQLERHVEEIARLVKKTERELAQLNRIVRQLKSEEHRKSLFEMRGYEDY